MFKLSIIEYVFIKLQFYPFLYYWSFDFGLNGIQSIAHGNISLNILFKL